MATERHFLYAGFCALTVLVSCTAKEEANPVVVFPEETHYFIVNNTYPAQGPAFGTIATYTSPGEKLTKDAFSLSLKGAFSDIVSDLAISGSKMYVARSASAVVEIVDLTSMKVETSVSYARAATINGYKHIDVTDSRIIVSDRGFVSTTSFDNESFLKVIHLDQLTSVDSVPVVANAAIYAVAAIRNKIFVSVGPAPHTLIVYDAQTYAKLTAITLGGLCPEMLLDKDDNLLVFTKSKILKFNTSDLTVMSEKAFFPAQLNVWNDYTTCSTAISIDKENNVLYYLALAPQPASAPFLLNSYDLGTDVNTLLLPVFISAQTLGFDQKNKLILLGDFARNSVGSQTGAGVVKRLEKSGATSSQLDLTNPPSKIIVRQ